MKKYIVCQRCVERLAVRTRKPRRRTAYAMTEADYIYHQCAASGMDTPCWIWRWGATGQGYPKVRRGQTVASPLSENGGTYIVRFCGNPGCVNPEHSRHVPHIRRHATMAA